MQRVYLFCLTTFALLLSTSSHATLALFDWGINIDGHTGCALGPCAVDGSTVPPLAVGAIPGLNAAGFDFATGLGVLTIQLSGAGAHHVSLFVDHEIDEAINGFANEFGVVSGVPVAGRSFEIDEPGYTSGDLFAHFVGAALDGTVAISAAAPDDVAMALGWDFALAAGQSAQVVFTLASVAPMGFHLQQADADSSPSVYFSSALNIAEVPAGTSLPLLVLAGLALAWQRRRCSSL